MKPTWRQVAIEAVDPDQPLVAAEFEARWNATLRKAQDPEDRLRAFRRRREAAGDSRQRDPVEFSAGSSGRVELARDRGESKAEIVPHSDGRRW